MLCEFHSIPSSLHGAHHIPSMELNTEFMHVIEITKNYKQSTTKQSEINSQIYMMHWLALRVFQAKTMLTVYRLLNIMTRRASFVWLLLE